MANSRDTAADALRAERDNLAAAVARVRELADRGTYKHDREHMGTHAAVMDGFARSILDALDVQTAAQSHTCETAGTPADRMRALAGGPPLDLPPVRWEAPAALIGYARWGALPWEAEPDVARAPRVYLYAYDIDGIDGPFLDVGDERCTVAEAKTLLNRIASAIAMAEEVSR